MRHLVARPPGGRPAGDDADRGRSVRGRPPRIGRWRRAGPTSSSTSPPGPRPTRPRARPRTGWAATRLPRTTCSRRCAPGPPARACSSSAAPRCTATSRGRRCRSPRRHRCSPPLSTASRRQPSSWWPCASTRPTGCTWCGSAPSTSSAPASPSPCSPAPSPPRSPASPRGRRPRSCACATVRPPATTRTCGTRCAPTGCSSRGARPARSTTSARVAPWRSATSRSASSPWRASRRGSRRRRPAPAPGDILAQAGDGTKLAAATGWAPEIPLDRSLADLLESLRARPGGR